MHPRSPYVEYTDFSQLAQSYPSLARYLTSNHKSIDFKDPAAVRELTTCLLARDFKLTIQLPPDRLCPAVPNRLNYVLWIQDLVDSTSGGPSDAYDPERTVVGLDIGTGASCIYPLLACASRPKWHMYGTDVDAVSLATARANVHLNNERLGGRITVIDSTAEGPLFPPGLPPLDFTICNPPFYSSGSSSSSAPAKALPPSAVCTGSEKEMMHEGGEAAFVARIIAESAAQGSQRTWYSTMLGKLSSLAPLVELVKQHTGNYAVTEFRQGKTGRWGLAWCYGDLRPRLTGGKSAKGAFPTVFVLGGEGCRGVVVGAVKGLGVRWTETETEMGGGEGGVVVVGWGEADGNVWSRAARRRRARGGEMEMETEGGEVKMGFRVEMAAGEVLLRWTRGRDQVLWESFCGALRRCVKGGVGQLG